MGDWSVIREGKRLHGSIQPKYGDVALEQVMQRLPEAVCKAE